MQRRVVKEDLSKSLWLDYPSAITDIAEQNKSFDACMIRVMYTGKNRNKTSISKAAVERALPTIYNCPIVCNYNIEEDTIGGHDVDVVSTDEGVRLINLTDAIGVIPAGAEYHWEEICDGNETHEYLCIGGLLWKRTPAYEKIKRDGVSGQSMEINVERGQSVDGYYEINDFSFTALCILGDDVTPCFENASIETFSLGLYKKNFTLMMEDFKREYSTVMTASADDIYKDSLEGGNGKVNIDEMMAKYGLSAEDINFDTAEMSAEELEAKFNEIAAAKSFADDDNQEGNANGQDGNAATEDGDNTEEEDDDTSTKCENNYSLTAEQFRTELIRALQQELIYDEYWECEVPRYWYVDYDTDALEVYAEDRKDYNIYGMVFTINGDHVEVDFANAKRKKIAFVDFEGEIKEGNTALFAAAEEVAKRQFDVLRNELADLRQFKEVEDKKRLDEQKNEVFSRFSDLIGNKMFDDLKDACAELSIEQIEEKCFAIRGRITPIKFSAEENKPVRTPVEKGARPKDDEPYGGVFLEYGFGSR